MARTMLLALQLSKMLWAKVVFRSNLLCSKLPSKGINMHIPYSVWYDCRPEMAVVPVFSTKGYIFQHRPSTVVSKKFLPRTLLAHFLGMESEDTFYRNYISSLHYVQVW